MKTENKREGKLYFTGLITILVLLCVAFGTFFAMRTRSVPDSDVLYIAHRGMSGRYYQNSLKAFEHAADKACFYGIETDIRYTSDGKFVCVHDAAPFKDTEKDVSELTFDEVMNTRLDATVKRYVVTLDEYLNVCKDSGKIAIIEIKYDTNNAMTEQLVRHVRTVLDDDEFIFIAFSVDTIDYIEGNYSALSTQWLTKNPQDVDVALAKGYDLSVTKSMLTEELVEQFHAQGLKVGVWTVNNSYRKYIEMGVDYITTNYPVI